MESLVVFNCCAISGRDNTDRYLHALEHLRKQQGTDMKLVVSGCRLLHHTKLKLMDEGYTCIFTDDYITVNCSFNKCVKECVKRFGKAKSYFYVDSGVEVVDTSKTVPDDRIIEYMHCLLAWGGMGVVSSNVNSDSCFGWWRGLDQTLKNRFVVMPVGWGVANHLVGFHSDIFEAFGGLLPDVFAGDCSESIQGFIAASVQRSWLIMNVPVVVHHDGMDGAGSGFFQRGRRGDPKYFIDAAPRSCDQIISDPEFYECGMGYEECRRVAMHRGDLYSDLGNVRDPERLKRFIKSNFFLPESFYNNIKFHLMPMMKVF